jgi:tRNA pseudouridine38-40 synthase
MNTDQPVPGIPGDGLIRLRLDISYDGRDYFGWARQTDLRTVQGELERMLSHLYGVHVDVTCAGRTDAGVHARGQVAHMDVPGRLEVGLDLRRINRALPGDVRINAITKVPESFDARFSAMWRRYSYAVCDSAVGPAPLARHMVLPWSRPLDLEALNKAADGLVGEHDFTAFCKPRDFASSVREIQLLRWSRVDGLAVLAIQADAFCHSMVRSLVGVMLPVGDGRRSVSWPAEVLASGARHSAVTVMPPFPLVLEEVGYPADDLLLARQQQTRTFRGASDPRQGC